MGAARKIEYITGTDANLLPVAAPLTTIVYGPVDSRRFGRTLGINLFGANPKICSFDCPYCSLGTTQVRLNKLKNQIDLPSVNDISAAVNEAFKQIHTAGPPIDQICISGNGEPTLHPDFPDIVKVVLAARDAWMPGKPVLILTNGAGFDSKKVIDAVNSLDERVVKLDAGNERAFKAIAAPLSRANLSKIISGIRQLKDFIAQTMFVQGIVDNTLNHDIDDWIEVIAMLHPKAVQIHGLNQKPAVDGLVKCDEDTLYMIASRLERKTGFKALVTP